MFTCIRSFLYKIKYMFNDGIEKSNKYKYNNKRILYNNNVRRYATPCTFNQQYCYDYIEYS